MKTLSKAQLKKLAITSDDDLLKEFPAYTRKYLREQKRSLKSVNEQIDQDIKEQEQEIEYKTLNSKYKELLKKVGQLEDNLDVYNKLKNNNKILKIVANKTDKGEATAFLVASDWHIDEKVDPDTVNDLNYFNMDIAEQRAKQFFVNGVKLVKREQRDTEIKTIVLALLGDFISGKIHEELKENRTALTNTAILKAQEMLAGGIQYILDNTDCNLVIPCSSGNHGRQTEKVHISTEYENSFETLIYKSLELMFKSNKRVEFIIKKSYHTIIDIYGFKIRLHHGHNIKFSGGVGGPTISANKKIANWDISIPVYLDVFGHLHQKFDGEKFIMNGCLIGYNAYAISLGAKYQKPSQQFFLIDKKHGKTIVAPIFLE